MKEGNKGKEGNIGKEIENRTQKYLEMQFCSKIYIPSKFFFSVIRN